MAQRRRARSINVLSLMSARRDDQLVCVARISGANVQRVVDDLWESGHQVINVLRC